MTSAKFASLHGGLLARKGLATPATLPLPVMPQQPRPRYKDAPPPAVDETCCGGASGGDAEKVPAVVPLRAVRSTNPPRVVDHDAQQEINADLRTHVSVRLSPDQMRRLKTAAAQLHLSRQKIVADGLDVYLDKLAVEDLAGCRCLKARTKASSRPMPPRFPPRRGSLALIPQVIAVGRTVVLKHSHAKICRSTVLLDAESLETVYVIETDLALSQGDPDFDASAFESLVQAVRGYIAEHPNYDSARLERTLKT